MEAESLSFTGGPSGTVRGGRLRSVVVKSSPSCHRLGHILEGRLHIATERRRGVPVARAAPAMAMMLADVDNRMWPVYSHIPRNDLTGLVGEFVSEMLTADYIRGDPVFVKWRMRGTSLSRGLDLVFGKDGRVYACESKHLHSYGRTASGTDHRVASEIKKALLQNTDKHIASDLLALCLQFAEDARRADAADPDCQDYSLPARRHRFLRGVLDAARYSSSVMVVIDGSVALDVQAINAKIDPAILAGFATTVTVYLVCVDNLHCETERLIGGCDLQ